MRLPDKKPRTTELLIIIQVHKKETKTSLVLSECMILSQPQCEKLSAPFALP